MVDNGSGDGTVEHLRARWPDVVVVALGENVGFAAGVNRGLERARGEFVALINNDVELDPDCLRELVAGLEGDPGAASAASKMLRFDDRGVIDATGDTLRWSGVALQRGQGERDRGQYDRPERVFSACAGRGALPALGVRRGRPLRRGVLRLSGGRRLGLPRPARWGTAASTCRPRSPTTSARPRLGARASPTRSSTGCRAATTSGSCSRTTRAARCCALRRCCSSITPASSTSRSATAWRGRTSPRWRAAARGLPRVLRQRRAIQAARRVGRRELEPLITRGRPPR